MPEIPEMLRGAAIILTACVVCACSGPPRVAAIPEAARQQDSLWPTSQPWRAGGRLTVTMPDGTVGGSVHLLALDGNSLRVVLMADGGAVLDDVVLTSADRGGRRSEGPLGRLGPALRHALLPVSGGEPIWQGSHRQVIANDGAYRRYGGDPVALRQIQGDWGTAELSDFRIVDQHLVPHRLGGAVGRLSWQLTLRNWQRWEQEADADGAP